MHIHKTCWTRWTHFSPLIVISLSEFCFFAGNGIGPFLRNHRKCHMFSIVCLLRFFIEFIKGTHGLCFLISHYICSWDTLDIDRVASGNTCL